MMRYLKTLYPCRRCGVSTRVTTRKLIEYALCPTCSLFSRGSRLAHWADERAKRLASEANRAQDRPADLVRAWTSSLVSRLEACEHMTQLLPLLERRERWRYALNLRTRLKAVSRALEALDDWVEVLGKEASGLELIETDNPLALELAQLRQPPALSVVKFET